MPKTSRIFIIASQNAQLEHNSERSWLDKRSTYSDTPVKKRNYFLLNKKKKNQRITFYHTSRLIREIYLIAISKNGI